MRHTILGMGIALGCLCLYAKQADAFIIYGYGDKIKHVSPLPPNARQKIRTLNKVLALRPGTKQLPEDYAIGYKHGYFSLFFMDMWTWSGQFVLYKDNQYRTITPKLATYLEIKVASLQKPFLYRFPLGLLVLLGGILIFAAIGIFLESDEQKLARLSKDVRYERALQIFDENVENDPENIDELTELPSFQLAVSHLVAQKINKTKAQDELVFLIVARENAAKEQQAIEAEG